MRGYPGKPVSTQGKFYCICVEGTSLSSGLFTLTQMDLGTDTDSDFNPKATLYYVEHVHIAETQIPTTYFCVGQISESESVSGNVNEPLWILRKMNRLAIDFEISLSVGVNRPLESNL